MRVLLVSPNQEFLPDPVAPIGLSYVAAALREAGHEVRLLDLCFAPDIEAAIQEELDSFPPQCIGFSIRNVDNTAYPHSTSYIEPLRRVTDLLRRYSPAPIVAGGSGFTVMPEELLGLLGLEWGIVGEGERSLVQFLAQGGRGPVPGLLRRNGGSFESLPPSSSLDLDGLPLPARDLLDVRAYLHHGGVCNIQSKRGCSFRCAYCTYPLIEGSQVRLRNPEGVVSEMEGLHRDYDIGHFFFVDNVFNYPPQHAEAICDHIVSRNLKIRWTCYAHPGYLGRTLADRMARAGCESVEFGTDSGSPPVLAALRKDFGPEEIRQASASCREAGIPFCHSLIFGAPGEDRATVQQTFRLMEEIDPTAVVAMIGVRVYPRTPLALRLVEEGWCRPVEIAHPPKFYLSPAIGDELIDLVVAQAAGHRSWIVPGCEINFSLRVQQLFRRKGRMGPIWVYLRYLRERIRDGASEAANRENGKG